MAQRILKYTGTLLSTVLLFSACRKEKYFAGPNQYADSFENYSLLRDALPAHDLLWSFTQLTESGNSILPDTQHTHTGKKSMHFFAVKSPSGTVSKSSIAKQNMAFWAGETVRVSAWYFLEGNEKNDWLFLMDMEEQVAIGAGPGIRLALVNNQLRMEHKYNEKDVLQPENAALDFPRNQWVHLVWEVKLSQKNQGAVKVWQNDTLILQANPHRTLPRDFLYFQQGTKGMYSSIEIGITANTRDRDIHLWVDDFEIEKIR